MTNIQKKAARADIIADIENYLLGKAYEYKMRAQEYLEYATDEDSGEVNKNDWHYQQYDEYTGKANMVEAVIKELEKF